MGLDLLLPLFAAAILGGIGSVPGAMLAGLIVGLAEALTVQLVGAEWRAAVAFVILSPSCSSARRACSGGPTDARPLRPTAPSSSTMALTYAIICLGLNLQWGQTGLFNVGVAGFVAIGAYASALLTTPDAPDRLGGFGLPDRRRLARRRAGRRARDLPRRRRSPCGCAPTISPSPPSASPSAVQLVRAEPRGPDRRPLRHRLHPAPLRRHGRRPDAASALPEPRRPPRSSSRLVYLALERLVRSPWGRVLRAIREDEAAAARARQERRPLPPAGLRHRRRDHGPRRRACRRTSSASSPRRTTCRC